MINTEALTMAELQIIKNGAVDGLMVASRGTVIYRMLCRMCMTCSVAMMNRQIYGVDRVELMPKV